MDTHSKHIINHTGRDTSTKSTYIATPQIVDEVQSFLVPTRADIKGTNPFFFKVHVNRAPHLTGEPAQRRRTRPVKIPPTHSLLDGPRPMAICDWLTDPSYRSASSTGLYTLQKKKLVQQSFGGEKK